MRCVTHTAKSYRPNYLHASDYANLLIKKICTFNNKMEKKIVVQPTIY